MKSRTGIGAAFVATVDLRIASVRGRQYAAQYAARPRPCPECSGPANVERIDPGPRAGTSDRMAR